MSSAVDAGREIIDMVSKALLDLVLRLQSQSCVSSWDSSFAVEAMQFVK